MCRVLAYLGSPILLAELLYNPDSSLVMQTYKPKLLNLNNLAGFGMAAWDKGSHNSKKPYIYRIPTLPFYDSNLKNLASKIQAECLIAHIRGIEYDDNATVNVDSTHPFLFDNTDIAFAHNGFLVGFDEIRFELAQYMKEEYKIRIKSMVDSEWMYALFLSRLNSSKKKYTPKDIYEGILSTLEVIKEIRKKHNICYSSSLNFFISNGNYIAAIRYTLDFGHDQPERHTFKTYTSLWYTYGKEYGYFDHEYKMKGGEKKNSIIFASEPLTHDYTTWIELPEYTFISASLKDGEIQVQSVDMAF